MKASYNGHLSVVQLLLDHNADVNAVDNVRDDVRDHDRVVMMFVLV